VPATATAKAVPRRVTEITKPEDKPQPRILGFFKTTHREITASEVATALGLKIQTAHLILAKLVHPKKIERLASGHFKALGAVASSVGFKWIQTFAVSPESWNLFKVPCRPLPFSDRLLIANTGISVVDGVCFNLRSTSTPSISGLSTSRRTMLG